MTWATASEGPNGRPPPTVCTNPSQITIHVMNHTCWRNLRATKVVEKYKSVSLLLWPLCRNLRMCGLIRDFLVNPSSWPFQVAVVFFNAHTCTRTCGRRVRPAFTSWSMSIFQFLGFLFECDVLYRSCRSGQNLSVVQPLANWHVLCQERWHSQMRALRFSPVDRPPPIRGWEVGLCAGPLKEVSVYTRHTFDRAYREHTHFSM